MKKWQIIETFKLGGPGSGHYGHKGIPGQVGGSSVSYAGWVEDTAKSLTGRTSSEIVSVAKEAYSYMGITPNTNFGACAAVSTYMWDKLGQPKSIVPTSVYAGEDEHVVLYSAKERFIIDPTANQYQDSKSPVLMGDKDKFGYSSFKRLSTQDMESVREGELSVKVG